jgi:hypothetical protein
MDDCNLNINSQRTKIKRIDFPEWSVRMDVPTSFFQGHALPGRDTRLEIKDAHKNRGAPSYTFVTPRTTPASGAVSSETSKVAASIDQTLTLNDLIKPIEMANDKNISFLGYNPSQMCVGGGITHI